MIHEPQTDAERAIYSALVVLLNNRGSAAVSPERFLTLCKAAPDYSLRMIEGNRTSLMYTTGHARSPIAQLIMTVEWELKGPTAFIDDHKLGVESEYTQFMEQRIKSHPHEFKPADLDAILRNFKREGLTIRQVALEALTDYVTTFADRLAAEPPGMSEDVEALKRSINSYGFGDDLNAILTKIDDELQKPQDAFDQVSTMRHIRSFFEALHEAIGRALQVRRPKVGNGTPLEKCGQAIDYLERKQVTTPKIKELGRCLYAILSDGDFGVHALKASRDYTRLCRNMVVEYAVTLFLELDRRLAEPGDS